MAYTKEELVNLGAQNISDARSRIVGIHIFDNIDDIKLTSQNFNLIDYTLDLYTEYLTLLSEFSKINIEKILRSLKRTEVVDNHHLEQEDYDLLRSYNETHHSTAINYLIRKLITEKVLLNSTIILKAHEILMRGTSNENTILLGFRNNNHHFVGYFDNGQKNVLYYPISYDEISRAIALLCSYYNSNPNNEEDFFIKPIVIHGLFSALQVFEDGNTRLARTFQHMKLFDSTRLSLDSKLIMPAIYFSKSYIPYRFQYRELITQIAQNPTCETWNKWISFNLKRLQDQIFHNEENLKRTRKM